MEESILVEICIVECKTASKVSVSLSGMINGVD